MSTNTITATPPVVPAQAFNLDAPLIVVRLRIPTDPVHAVSYPASNMIGTWLLCSLLEKAMELAGVRVYQRGLGMELNRSFFLFSTSDFNAGLSVIKEELESFSLVSCAVIGWFDPREMVARTFHPAGVSFEIPTSAEIKEGAADINTAIELIALVRKETDEPDGI